ncbi:MAG: phage tail tape measure protein, partial [Desulfobulbaceae bacterium]|nr:phage tail tape measure protein [Desulfobulbaceae bacterium]
MKTFGVKFNIGAGLTGNFNTAMGMATSRVDGLASAVKGLGKIQTKSEKFKKLESELGRTASTLDAAKRRAADLGRELVATEKPTNKLRQEFEKSKRVVAGLKEKHREQKNSLVKVKEELKQAGFATSRFRSESDRLTKSLDRAKKAQAGFLDITRRQRANLARRDSFQGALFGAAGMAASVAVPLKMAVDFESAMADVRKVVDLEAPGAFKQMGDDILSMTTDKGIPMAAAGMAKIVEAAGQSGLAKSREELLSFAETAAKMGVAFDISADQAGEMMAKWRTGMALDQSQAESLANVVNHLSNNLAATAGDLGQVLQRQGAVAMAAGLTEKETASLGAAFLAGGAKMEIAATGLKNFTGALTKGKAATKAQQDAFQALGLDAVEMASKMQENAPAAIREVIKALSEAPKEEQNSLVSQLFGDESKGAIMPLLKNQALLAQAFDLTSTATAYAGSMQAEFASRSNTTANKLQLLQNRATRLGVNVGTILLPPLNRVAAAAGWVTDKAATLTAAFPKTSAVVLTAGAGLAALSVAGIAAGYASTFVVGGWLNAAKALKFAKLAAAGNTEALLKYNFVSKAVSVATTAWTAAQSALNIAMVANPIGLVVAGAAALGAAALVVYQNWQPISAFFGGVWAGVKDGLTPVFEAFKPFAPVFSAIGSAVSSVGRFLMDLVNPVQYSADALGKATSAGATFGKVVGSAIRFAFAPLEWGVRALGWVGEKLGLLKGAPLPG